MNARRISRRRANPFTYTRPIVDPESAIERKAVVDKIVRLVNQGVYVAVMAPRQSGKTTLLSHLRQRIDRCSYVDLGAGSHTDLRALTLAIAESVPDLDARLCGEENLITFLSSLSKRRVFLIDELCDSRNVAADFLRAIRAFSMNSTVDEVKNRHVFVIAGSTDLADLTIENDSLVSPFNIAEIFHLEDFSPEEVGEFLRRMTGGKFTDQTIELVTEYTTGHPYLVQFLCHHLFEMKKGRIQSQLKRLPELVEGLRLDATVNVNSMIRNLWDRGAAAKEYVTVLEAILQGERIRYLPSQRIVRTLYLQGCIRDEGGYCVIRNPIYELIFQKHSAASANLRRIQEKVAAPRPRGFETFLEKLKNFSGWLTVSMKNTNGPVPYDTHRGFVLSIDTLYKLEVRVFKNIEPPSEMDFKQMLRIEGGEEPTDAIELTIRPESFCELGLQEQLSRAFPPHIEEVVETYLFSIEPTHPTEQPVQLFLNIYQGVALAHITRVLLTVNES